ncbi:NADP-dependent isocitrate dehydrogenase [Pseudalkalibacillus caeni]|uniref:Isocitrate dehydrogenase [NADP] n=1 Tax=Exobacillus caeni TaxID=2574798 RepID=A0A5R9FCC9_9BACL|nr:NADP-dependent isocitrate dehydrogenase [Pseudalkalibacillus caeni]TLS38214.1 NADP-dependent isocitrate dehydrogenase [Pseudalkalibacillus caeni]
MAEKRPITVATGDGIGPEIMEAVLHILEQAGAEIDPEFIDVGEKVYLSGNSTGIPDEAWESLRRTKVLLKAPITTPQGGGYKSLNVTIRTAMGLYANVRPCVSYHPVIENRHPDMDLVIVRENEEDLYAGIEHQQTPEVVQSLKLISRPGSERIIRYAFEYARKNNRKKVTCLVKDNIMKLSDGLFHTVFKEIAAEYPEIESNHLIVDIGMARIADTPEQFDVLVMPNLYGDIASDIAAQIAGSVGLAGSANIGEQIAMFEAIHGSAPDIAGKKIANPSGLLHGAIMMLVHIGQPEIAEEIHNAWLRTIEDGVLTGDMAKGKESVGTFEFARAVVERLGKKPESKLQPVTYSKAVSEEKTEPTKSLNYDVDRKLDGVDVFLCNNELSANEIGEKLEEIAGPDLKLIMMTNRGVKVYPNGFSETFLSDHWRCRFQPEEGKETTHQMIRSLLSRIEEADLDWIKIENLYTFNGKLGYSLAQGQ